VKLKTFLTITSIVLLRLLHYLSRDQSMHVKIYLLQSLAGTAFLLSLSIFDTGTLNYPTGIFSTGTLPTGTLPTGSVPTDTYPLGPSLLALFLLAVPLLALTLLDPPHWDPHRTEMEGRRWSTWRQKFLLTRGSGRSLEAWKRDSMVGRCTALAGKCRPFKGGG